MSESLKSFFVGVAVGMTALLVASVCVGFFAGWHWFVIGFGAGAAFMLLPHIILALLIGRWAWRKYQKVRAINKDILPFIAFVELHEFFRFDEDNWVTDLGAHWLEEKVVEKFGQPLWPKIHAGLRQPETFGPWRPDFITAAQQLNARYGVMFPLDGVPEVVVPPTPALV